MRVSEAKEMAWNLPDYISGDKATKAVACYRESGYGATFPLEFGDLVDDLVRNKPEHETSATQTLQTSTATRSPPQSMPS